MRRETIVSILVTIIAVGCRRRREPIVDDPGLVPRAQHPITVNGEWGEPEWNSRALTGDLASVDGQPARPFSQVRLLADDQRLLIGLYAADEDIRTTDRFDVTVGALTLHYDPAGHVTPAVDGVHATVDRDGTIDQPDDFDEEWVIEADVPLSRVGLIPGAPPVALTARRCDVTKDGVERCGSWTARIHVGR